MLVKKVIHKFGDRVRYVAEDFGDSKLGEKLGVAQYPAIFIDDVLVATPTDFYSWEGAPRGRYTPWKEPENRKAFEDDFRDMIELRLSGGRLERAAADLDPAARPRLPEITLKDLAGADINTAEMKGEIVMVAFWAPWCPPCHDSLGWLLSSPERFGGDLNVLALAVQSEEAAVREAVAEHSDISARVAMADPDQAGAFGGVMSVPMLMIFDREGVLSSVFYGAPPDLHERIAGGLAAAQGEGAKDTQPAP